MNWKVLKTTEDYNAASGRLMAIFNAEPGTPDGDEMELLMVLVKDYDAKHYSIPIPDPLKAIKIKLKKTALRLKTRNQFWAARAMYRPFFPDGGK